VRKYAHEYNALEDQAEEDMVLDEDDTDKERTLTNSYEEWREKLDNASHDLLRVFRRCDAGVTQISIENTGRCPRCRTFITSEQMTSHNCSIPIKHGATIWLDWMADGFTDENDDYVRMATGLDGTLFELVTCKHNPPHSLESQWLTGNADSSKRPPDKLPVYPYRGVPHESNDNVWSVCECGQVTRHKGIRSPPIELCPDWIQLCSN